MSEARRLYSGPPVPPREIIGRRGSRVASTRSIASSITFDDASSTTDYDMSGEFDPFMESSLPPDNPATMPQRRQSGVLMLTPQEQELLADTRPGMPQRRQSQVHLAPVTEESLRASTDSAPARPVRQQSVASGSTRDLRQKVPDAVSSSFSSSAEPVLDYLPFDESMVESKLKELTQKARIFLKVVDIQDRRYHLKTFKRCFIGSEAVDRMLQAGLASSRTEAVELGRNFMKYLGLFRHVTEGHVFKDKYLFYKFQKQQDISNSSNDNQSNSSDESGKNISTSARLLNLIANPGSSSSSNNWYSASHRSTINEDEPTEEASLP
ncbi:Rap guanine nucleotide exchange factor 4 [Seminavis robusta]|uniref:Rap guanine nucleotide exchange factor 4 n=1 Tax=Seminavis robusta TaxID=568900 RepID=A0A9N8DTZ3_9STRA|nr:Rap guanine nucleotide exchange factor 4 [Seminavis robusta]|eukprot:Sro369_g128270.1 Rap guanine nucleotide exchange factor 4 (324) ;mRNA; r:57327-58298